MQTLHRLTIDPDTDSKHAAALIRAQLDQSYALHVVGLVPDDPRAYWNEVTDNMGRAHDLAELPDGTKTGEKWMEIRFDPSIPNAYRHSKNAQPMHTDGSYISDAPAILCFYCVAQAPTGGATVFISGPELVATLREKAPNLLERLMTTPVRFSKAHDAKRRPIIQEPAPGEVVLTWNYHCVDDPPNAELAEAFHEFLTEHVVKPERVHGVRLQPGDALFWWDERSLHGRRAFQATQANERFFWKTGIHL